MASPDETARETPAAPPPAAKPRRRISFALVGQAAAVVGLVGGIVGLVFTFVPGLRPEPSARQSASIAIADLNDRATLREYLNAEGIPRGSLAPSLLTRLGVLTTVRYTATGLDGKVVRLVVTLTERDTGIVACKHTYPLKAGGGAPPTFRAWTPFPARPGAANSLFNLHATLFAPDGRELDAADRNGIPGLGRAQPGPSNSALPVSLC